MRSILILSVLSIALLLTGTVCTAEALPQEVWNKTYKVAGDGWVDLVLQTSDGGYLIAGRVKNCDECTADAWLVKTDSNGIEQWNKTLEDINLYLYSENVRPPLRRIWSSSTGGYRNIPLPVVSESGEVIFYTSSQVDPDTHWMKQTINAMDALNPHPTVTYPGLLSPEPVK